jgi:hypothetical protein
MKCDTACKSLNGFGFSEKAGSGVGRRFRDEREYLAFLLEQERAWEDEHLELIKSSPDGGRR